MDHGRLSFFCTFISDSLTTDKRWNYKTREWHETKTGKSSIGKLNCIRYKLREYASQYAFSFRQYLSISSFELKPVHNYTGLKLAYSNLRMSL